MIVNIYWWYFAIGLAVLVAGIAGVVVGMGRERRMLPAFEEEATKGE